MVAAVAVTTEDYKIGSLQSGYLVVIESIAFGISKIQVNRVSLGLQQIYPFLVIRLAVTVIVKSARYPDDRGGMGRRHQAEGQHQS